MSESCAWKQVTTTTPPPSSKGYSRPRRRKRIRQHDRRNGMRDTGQKESTVPGVTISIFIPINTLVQMATNGEKCGLSSLLPLSCRGRAEAFAKSLQTRLKNLGAHTNNNNADESSWLAVHENPIATSQPRHVLDFCLLDPPESPEGLEDEEELHRLINGDSLTDSGDQECHRVSSLRNIKSSSDSDSDVFYDVENDSELERRLTNGESSHTETCNTEICQNGVYDNAGSGYKDDRPLCNSNNDSGQDTSQNEMQISAECGVNIENRIHNNEDTNQTETESRVHCNRDEELGQSRVESEAMNETSPNDQTEDPTENKSNLVDSLTNGTDSAVIESPSCTQNEFYSTISDLSDDMSSLSLRDEDCPSDSLELSKSDVECDTEIKRSDEVYVSQTVEIQESSCNDNTENDKDSSDDDEIPRVRRCSSLKTGKTPPGTPGRKKIVRFADALGLDLADVRTFLDEVPKVPNSAYEDLSVDLTDSPVDSSLESKSALVRPEKILLPLFQQPGGLPNFLDLVRDNFVCLENAVIDDPYLLTIKGVVRVRNLDFHKSVYVRYTLNSWKTFADAQAKYVENSCDGFSDKFTFEIYAHSLTVGQRLELACRFQCKGCQYWDNNNGKNYIFQCLPIINHAPTTPITGALDWGNTASFYY